MLKCLRFLPVLAAVMPMAAQATVCDAYGNCASSPMVPQYAPPVQQAKPQPPQDVTLGMICTPTGGVPYKAKIVISGASGHSAYITSWTGKTTYYAVQQIENDGNNHVLNADVRNFNQPRTMFLRFDYSHHGRDTSRLRTIGDNGTDNSDNCAFVD
jgi:hypothetical protein